MIFCHSGHLGDVLYSLPTINHLTNGERSAILYIKERNERDAENGAYTQYTALADLLIQQPCIKQVLPYRPSDNNWSDHYWPGLQYDYDLDRARNQRNRRYIFHVKRYFDEFGIDKDYKSVFPFLTIDELYKRNENYALFHVTPRWHGYVPNWRKIYDEAKDKYEKIYFTGYGFDHLEFQIRYGIEIEHLPTSNLLDLARLIRDSQALYCNQCSALVIAQGLQKRYYLSRNADRTHCHLHTENETLI